MACGFGYDANLEVRAFRWSSGGGMVDLPGTADTISNLAFAVSGDGAVVVGTDDSTAWCQIARGMPPTR